MSGLAPSVLQRRPCITLRRAKPEDAPVCGRAVLTHSIGIRTNYGFPPDFPSLDVAVGVGSGRARCKRAKRLASDSVLLMPVRLLDLLKRGVVRI
jgi:hypothetical protein